MTYAFADPMQLWLDISPSIQTISWQHAQAVQASSSRWQIYINQLCLRTVLAWLKLEQDIDARPWPLAEASPASWELVSGSAVTIDDKKIVLIPQDGVGHDEIEISQEWIDIPDWEADYYLAIQINVEEGWIECWGYATHQQVKASSEYDAMERMYSLSSEYLVPDLNALWATLEFCPSAETKAALEPLPELSKAQAEDLVVRLSEASFPRLSVPFDRWGALLANETWRQQLWERRLTTLSGSNQASRRFSLSQYLQEMQSAVSQGTELVLSAGWQSVETVFGAQSQQMAFSFREEEQLSGKQAKVIQLDQVSVRLVMLWQSEPDGRLAIRAQLYPDEGSLYLSPNVAFSLVSEQDEVLQSIRSEVENNYIQLPLFRCPSEYAFGILVQLDDSTVTERFVT